MVHLYNTLTRSKEIFTPAEDNIVRAYSCGPTVYSRQHIGNMRAAVFVDVLKRALRYNGYAVDDVVNITDVGHLAGDNDGDANTGEDRMEKAARAEGKDPYEIARHYEKLYVDDLKKLNIVVPQHLPRASDHIAEQIAMIQAMETRGFTYTIDDGVYFDVSKLPGYGKLSRQKLDDKADGARVALREGKRQQADFALWKFLVGEHANHVMRWESPWGVGFPGWHLECSAMGHAYLGDTIDIHTGGIEHIPIHHENEIAQNEGSGLLTVRFWLHNEHLLFEGGKMAKSLGNVYSLDDLAQRGITPLGFRYWLLSGHYRTSLNFTEEAAKGAQQALARLVRTIASLDDTVGEPSAKASPEYRARFLDHINNDLDTPQALALVWEVVRSESLSLSEKRATLFDFDRVLGLGFVEHREELALIAHPAIPFNQLPPPIQKLVRDREQARNDKEWSRADIIRTELTKAGYRISDADQGSLVYAIAV